MSYIDITHGSNSVRLYLSMPYLVEAGSIYYLPDQPGLSAKGEVELSPLTASKILDLIDGNNTRPTPSNSSSVSSSSLTAPALQNPASRAASSAAAPKAGSVSSVTIVKKEPAASSRKAEMKSSVADVKVEKNDRPVKRDYNNAWKDDFIPVDSIVIDPGHGGKDPGALGIGGIKEKEIVLTIAQDVFQELRKNGKEKIYFTRKDDRYVTLKERTDKTSSLIRKGLNPIFVSIHGNISLNRNTDGLEVYSLSDKASDAEALTVEMAENAGFSRNDVEKTRSLSLIINDMLKDGIRRQSEELSKSIATELNKEAGTPIRGIKKANFYVLKYNSLPAVLVEVGFMSNPDEAKKLMDPDYQKKAAKGIAEGIRDFLENYNKSRGFTK
jgi:N-acetylmuramoyl-L-alanine amidase